MASWFGSDWAPTVIATPEEIRERLGRDPTPVRARPRARKIAQTFWGNAWCNHLEAYRDLSNRLPRGRTYLRNGSVRDLHVELGRVTGLVQGTQLYEVSIDIEPMREAPADALIERIGGGLASVVELLDGRLDEPVMRAVTDPKTGLFPERREISFGCSCPDGARVCKHVAAVFYGVALRLDEDAELFFRLRGIEPSRLVDAAPLGRAEIAGERRLDGDLGAIFGVWIEDVARESLEEEVRPKRRAEKRTSKRAKKKRATKKKPVAKKKKKPVAKKTRGKKAATRNKRG